MEVRTKKIIETLLIFNSLSEAINKVCGEHSKLKKQLEIKGLQFYNDELPLSQEIISNDIAKNKDILDDIRFYEELNYVRVGLTKQWIYNIYEPKRYNKIRKSVSNIQDIFKLDVRKKLYA